MKRYKYKNYAEYVKAQKSANIKKAQSIWAVEENIKFLAEYMQHRNPKSGLCHGTRGGYEQAWFNKYLDRCHVIGSEIGNASAPLTVQWDFNRVNPDWICQFDFIYSNSFDHAFDPEETLNVWVRQLRSGGVLILEYDKRNEHTGEISKAVNKTDPISITVDELVNVLIPKWIPDLVQGVKILDMPVVKKVYQKSIIIEVV